VERVRLIAAAASPSNVATTGSVSPSAASYATAADTGPNSPSEETLDPCQAYAAAKAKVRQHQSPTAAAGSIRAPWTDADDDALDELIQTQASGRVISLKDLKTYDETHGQSGVSSDEHRPRWSNTLT
jgi:hypothetical protein